MIPDLTPIASEAAPLLAALAFKSALVLAAALAVVSLMHRAAAASRHAVLATAMAFVLALPFLLAVMPSWNVSVPMIGSPNATVHPESSIEVAAREPAVAPLAARSPVPEGPATPPTAPEASSAVDVALPAESGGLLGALGAGITAAPGAANIREVLATGWLRAGELAPRALRDWRAWFLLVWLFGAAIVAGRWAVAFANARHLLADAVPLTGPEWSRSLRSARRALGISRPVRLLRSDRLAVPVAWCFGRHAVILPADCEEWSAERRKVVLMHELAHVARHDGATQVTAQAAVVLNWFNPLAWIAYRRLLVDREQACDDLVLACGTRPSDYADHLLQVARRFRQESLALLAVAAMARQADLGDRIEAILDPAQRRGGMSPARVALVALAAAIVVAPLAAFSPIGLDRDGSDPAAGVTTNAAASPAPDGQGLTAAAPVSGQSDWQWEGRAARGELVEVYGLNGAIRIVEGEGNRVRVEGTPRGRNAHRARLVVNDVRGGVVICVVHEGQRGCEPGSGPSGRARNTNNANVNLEVTVPRRVRVQARTTNGTVRTDEMSAAVDVRTTNGAIHAGSRTGDVRARATNGAITLTVAGRVDAQTTNGSINARIQSTNWSGSSRLAATNGSVNVQLPRSANVRIDARTGTGSIRSDFQAVDVVRRRGAGATASGTIGRGGRDLEIRTTNGGIVISGGSGSAQAAPAVPPSDPAANAADANAAPGAGAVAGTAIHPVDTAGLGTDVADLLDGVISEAMLLSQDVSGVVAEALAELDWRGIQADVASAIEEARLESTIGQEVRLALEEAERDLREARREIEEARLESTIGQEVRQALEEAQRDLREARREIEEGRPEN